MIFISKVFALLGLWLRLRWRGRVEQERHHYLLGVTKTVPPGGRVELDDHDGDGYRRHVQIIRTSGKGSSA
ncbi:hypothetical protein [Streptomyces canus]|uniref:hypothetical protein n=1 Tax=Streptomyces canus TaxID=58343 RepID=UPI0036E6DF35